MAPRLKFTTWMCQLGGQMCSYHAIYHANTLAVELSTERNFTVPGGECIY